MITYKNISVLDYEHKNPFIIPHIVNHSNQLGAGVAKALANKYPIVKSDYHDWYSYGPDFMLGEIQVLEVGLDIYVANMLAHVLMWVSRMKFHIFNPSSSRTVERL